MSEYEYLAYVVDPFGTVSPMFVLCDREGACRELTLVELAVCMSPVVTHHVTTLVDALRQLHTPLPKCIVDIGDGLRLRSGLSRDQGGESRWDVWGAAKEFFERPEDCRAARNTFEAKIAQPERVELFRLLSATSLALREVWSKLLSELEWLRERRRFLELEVPVQQVFWARQYSGIEVNKPFANQCRIAVADEKYRAFREVASILNMSPTGLNFRTLGPLLVHTDARHLREWENSAHLRDYFEIAQYSSQFAAAFVRFTEASSDLAILTLTVVGTARLFPTFNCFGTVTGRILVTNPRLQQLRKRYRGVIAPDPGKKLLYLDYAQFEPAILAAFAGDLALLHLYETEDLYSSLSVAVFGNRDERELCKKIFLAYSYGMSVDNIAKLLSGSEFSLERLMTFAGSVRKFFDAFPMLVSYRERSEEKLLADGFIGTVLGNRRVRQAEGPLTGKEQRWAVNQVIQGTASVVFKQAIINIVNSLGSECVLLPMHDAVLLQYEEGRYSENGFEGEVRELMIRAFERWVPVVLPKIVSQSFAPTSALDQSG